MKNILITGGAGFIGSHVVRRFQEKNNKIIVLDSLTYASNLSNIKDCQFILENCDIRNANAVNNVFETHNITDVIHLAAESHVDNSITNPNIFAETNVIGTLNLLNTSVKYKVETFYHVSTDEVYGAISHDDPAFKETTAYDPTSPYSASKASSDHFVRAFHHTYNLPVIISNCSNNYGPHQHTEKLIPKVISNIKDGKPIPVYGDGTNVRDWLWVGDHANAIYTIFHEGVTGETYNIGGENELSNLELINTICEVMSEYLDKPLVEIKKLITFVEDRKGHDFRYAINIDKIIDDTTWYPEKDFRDGLKETIKYYL